MVLATATVIGIVTVIVIKACFKATEIFIERNNFNIEESDKKK
jgi:hypothetical protein